MKSLAEFEQEIGQAVDFVQRRWKSIPRVGLILGTGSDAVADAIESQARWPFESLPYFAPSTATGHRGSLVCGSWNGQPVAAMQGRLHMYEGRSRTEILRPVRLLIGLGVQRLLISNAAGGVNPRFRVGDLMVIDSFIDLFFRQEQTAPPASDTLPPRLVTRPEYSCDPALADQAMETGRSRDVPMHRGAYAGLLGPSYETRAEYRMCRRLGADAVGMSTIPEIVLASASKIPVLAISIITNVATTTSGKPTTGHQVIASAEKAAHGLSTVFAGLLTE